MTNETRTPSDHDGIVEVDPADFERIDARGLLEARLTKLYAQLATVGKSYDAEAAADALTRIEAQSATIARLNAEVERMREGLIDIRDGCGMLNQPAAMNGPEEKWLKRRIWEMEKVARAALAPKEG